MAVTRACGSFLDSVRFVGWSESPRRKEKSIHPFQIYAEVIQAALDDAGLSLSEVDGLCLTGSDVGEGGTTESAIELAEYLGITPAFVNSTDVGGCSALFQAATAAAAINAGLATTVVIAYAACPRSFPFSIPTPMSWPIGPGAYEMQYGLSNVTAYALYAQRHMYQYGTTPEQLASVAVSFRSNARNNPFALMRDPITIEDVLTSVMISSPLHKLDCCVVTDSGGAVVLTKTDRARDCRRAPIKMLGYGGGVTRVHMNQEVDFTSSPGVRSGNAAFAMAGLSPRDVSVAQLYDAFTITPIIALEDLGFCPRGEGGRFVLDGHIAADARMPVNTDGGGLSSNHPGKRGIFVLIEALRQLRGEGPGVQVHSPEVSLAHAIGGFHSAAATLLLADG